MLADGGNPTLRLPHLDQIPIAEIECLLQRKRIAVVFVLVVVGRLAVLPENVEAIESQASTPVTFERECGHES